MGTQPVTTTIPVDHPLATRGRYGGGKQVNIAKHRVVLFDKIGYGPHLCHWCGRVVNWLPNGRVRDGRLTADHVNGDNHDNRPENLLPSCHGCNSIRSHPHPIIQDDEKFIVVEGKRRRAVDRTCEECGAAFLADPREVRRGRARFCCKSHAIKYTRRHKYWIVRGTPQRQE